jgi:hypothetical protein
MATDTTTSTLSEAPASLSAAKPAWRWQHYLSIVAIVFLAVEAWTLIAWVSHGVHPITRHRDTGSASFVIAKIYEVSAVLLLFGVGFYVVRRCVRERRFTFDAQLCVAGALAFWLEPVLYNFYVPTILYSSNFINVGNWCSHAPLVINKNCAANPEPLFIGIMYVVQWVVFGIIGGKVLDRVQRRRPLSMAKRLAVLAVLAVVIDMTLDWVGPNAHLWNEFAPTSISLFDSAHRLPLWIPLAAVMYYVPPMIVRYIRNDRGQTIFEQGLDHLRPRTRGALRFLSLVGFIQVTVAVTALFMANMGLYASHTPNYPPSIINNSCNVGSIHDSPYGPCPGTPGFRAPIRFLPGSR